MYHLLQVNAEAALSNLQKFKAKAIDYAPTLITAILVLAIGLWVIKLISRMLSKLMAAKHYDASLQTFLLSLFKVSMNILLIITVAGMLGINTTSFAALIAGAGLAIGAALNGSLGNLAGGVMMLVFKPFKVGDLIEAQGVVGNVSEIGIFTTTIITPENKTAIVPNGPLSTNIITNYTTAGYLRVDTNMAIAADANIDKAREIAIAAISAHPKVLQEPKPDVAVFKVGDGMVTLAIRPYTKQADYWDVYFGIQELVKKAWDTNGIAGPTPTRIIINK